MNPEDMPFDILPDVATYRGDFGLTLRLRRETRKEIEAIALKLLAILPHDTIFIDQQVGKVKNKLKMLSPSPRGDSGDRAGSAPAAVRSQPLNQMPGAAVAGPDPAGRREALRAGPNLSGAKHGRP